MVSNNNIIIGVFFLWSFEVVHTHVLIVTLFNVWLKVLRTDIVYGMIP